MSTLLAAMAACTSLAAEPMDERLAAIAKRYKMQLVYSSFLVANDWREVWQFKRSPAICYRSLDEALSASINLHGLRHDYVNDHTITIINAPPEQPAKPRAPQARLELSPAQITANAELPKMLFIVPWKRAPLGERPGKPSSTAMEGVLEPVDRDVFKRELRYEEAMR